MQGYIKQNFSLLNQVSIFQHWSQINETICFLNQLEIDLKKISIYIYISQKNINVILPWSIRANHNDFDILIRAFKYFVTSQSLSNWLQDDFKLSNVGT